MLFDCYHTTCTAKVAVHKYSEKTMFQKLARLHLEKVTKKTHLRLLFHQDQRSPATLLRRTHHRHLHGSI